MDTPPIVCVPLMTHCTGRDEKTALNFLDTRADTFIKSE
jgi:hypothetical protein